MNNKATAVIVAAVLGLFGAGPSEGSAGDGTIPPEPAWTLNALEYFEKPGLSVLVFQDEYPEGKQGGIEIIQHGERVAAVGDVRLEATPAP
jgi:hypothetical protein